MSRFVRINARVLFYETPHPRFRFPIDRTVRFSIWITEGLQQTFSEMHIKDVPVVQNQWTDVEIILPVIDFTVALKEGDKIFLGSLMEPVGEGVVLQQLA